MPVKMTRRQAIQTATIGLAGAAGCTTAPKTRPDRAERKSPGWIDAHVHVWTDDTTAYPLAEGFTKKDMKLPSFTPEALFAHCDPSGVARINLIQMSYYQFDNRYMLDMMAKYPRRFAGTGIVDVNAPDVADRMRRLGNRGVRAFRIYPSLAKRQPADWLQADGYDVMFRAGEKYNQALSCLIHPDALPDLDRMCTRFPDTPVIIDHLCTVGRTGTIIPAEREALCRMSRHRRVMIKVGAFYALGKKTAPYDDLLPLVRRVIESFGPRRCLWESDSPFQVTNGTYDASLALIRDHCDFLTADEKEEVLRNTAARFFFG